MTRNIDSITHTQTKYVKITINCADGDEDVKVAVNTARATVTAQYRYTPNEALMATEHVSADDDRGEAHAAIRNALAGLDVDDDIHRTIDRLERVGYWMDDQDPVLPDDILVDVHGDYKSLRSGQDMLLVQADNPTRGGQRPFVKVADKLPPVGELRESLDDRVEKRVMRNMCPQRRTYYEQEVDGRVRADIMAVESLEEAARVIRSDQGENNDHGSDSGDGGSDDEQATPAGY
ncbi:hypothetical protein Hlac_3290 (plasmid) [Halorubrum lacusprofundi ATCC 49239]|jgi:hypothetical protein|uniref:Uncharacterized protein n=1 Tax=Halorubrum lacusprofundi (strain ATCC 49239 / DSM 5036 / JCM 8891 / ACAM 34) TaxID=416348 RepID=B9LWH5_HALLT|nr:hypothetical protein [Halorubrum lacusprofundi]ACM58816.1 hypothetical protein Hlac_3290 [Halorubrum lacusprofundi ATCC 49239]